MKESPIILLIGIGLISFGLVINQKVKDQDQRLKKIEHLIKNAS